MLYWLSPVTFEGLQSVSRRNCQRGEGIDRMDLGQSALRHRPQLAWAGASREPAILAVEDIFRALVAE